MAKEKVLITGGAGFIGSHTADVLAEKGYAVRLLDNLQPPVHRNVWPAYVRGKGYELIKGDVRNSADWRRALKGVKYVYHFAAYQDQRPDFSTFFHVNTVGTALLYELIVAEKLPVQKVVLASSQFVYGDGAYRCPHNKKIFYPEPRTVKDFQNKKFDIRCSHGGTAILLPFKEDQKLTPTNSYGLSKIALEELSFRLGKTYGVPTTTLRYSIVQGARQSPHNLYSGALRIFVTQAFHGRPITVFEDGKQKRDFINIHDVVRANILVLRNPKTNFEIYNVGGGASYTIYSFAQLVKNITGSKSEIVVGGFRSTDTRHAISDSSKIKRLDWKPRFTPEKSVREYVTWYQENFFVSKKQK